MRIRECIPYVLVGAITFVVGALYENAVLRQAYATTTTAATQQTDPPPTPQSTFYMTYKVGLRMNQAGCTGEQIDAVLPDTHTDLQAWGLSIRAHERYLCEQEHESN